MKSLSILIVLTFILFNDLYSQEKTSSKEVGLYFSSLNSFGIRYKFGNEKRMFRLTALSFSVQDSKFENMNMNGNGGTEDLKNAGAGLNFGLEFPIKITDNFNFYYGGELRGSYNHTKSVLNNAISTDANMVKSGIGVIIGFSRSFNSNILVSAEIVPGFSYTRASNGDAISNIIGFGLDSNAAGITVGFKF